MTTFIEKRQLCSKAYRVVNAVISLNTNIHQKNNINYE